MIVGQIIWMSKPISDPNLLLADGSNFDAASYPDLSTLYGGGNTLPNYIGKFLRGSSNGIGGGEGKLVMENMPLYSDDGDTDEPQNAQCFSKAGGGETIYAEEDPNVEQDPVLPPHHNAVPYIVAKV